MERGRSSRKGTGCLLVGVAAVRELACEEQAEFQYRSKMRCCWQEQPRVTGEPSRERPVPGWPGRLPEAPAAGEGFGFEKDPRQGDHVWPSEEAADISVQVQLCMEAGDCRTRPQAMSFVWARPCSKRGVTGGCREAWTWTPTQLGAYLAQVAKKMGGTCSSG